MNAVPRPPFESVYAALICIQAVPLSALMKLDSPVGTLASHVPYLRAQRCTSELRRCGLCIYTCNYLFTIYVNT